VKKVALFAFKEDSVCFIHVLLNALDMKRKEYDVKIIIEGQATKLIPEFSKSGSFLHEMFAQVKGENLIEGVCRACSYKMNTLKDAEDQNLPLLADMSGHPGIARYIDNGYEIITF